MMCLLIPLVTASYAVRVPQYRCLQSGLLQCMNHFKPPCHLLMLRVTNPAHKRLALFGFLLLRTIFTIQGAHMVLPKCRLTEAVFQLLFFNLAHIQLDVINWAMEKSSTFIFKFGFS